MKMPTRKEIAIDAAWLMFKCVTSLVWAVILSPVFALYGITCLLLVVIGGIMVAIERLFKALYFFRAYPHEYFARTLKSIKVLMRYKEWKNEREK